jgi:hypothetical protein
LTKTVIAIVVLTLAVVLAGAGVLALASDPATEPAVGTTQTTIAPAIQREVIPRRGDCGTHAADGVKPVACDDPAADVEVARVEITGDPSMMCPLYSRDAVLFTQYDSGLFVCWVPRGGGPSRLTQGPAEPLPVAPPIVAEGMCGLIHADHVHHPLACDDPAVNAIAVAVLTPATDPAECPRGTVRAETLPDASVACWADHSA